MDNNKPLYFTNFLSILSVSKLQKFVKIHVIISRQIPPKVLNKSVLKFTLPLRQDLNDLELISLIKFSDEGKGAL